MSHQASMWLPFQQWLQQQVSSDAASSGGVGKATGGDALAPAAAPTTTPVTAQQLPPRPAARPALRAAASDCRAEVRLASEGAARQEALVLLASPCLPLHRAPVLSARQAASLVSVLAEPLVAIKCGRLTRRLAAPARLEPTAERGRLSLWLLPSDELVLLWQADRRLEPPPLRGPLAAPAADEACSVEVSEELALLPPLCHLADDAPPVAIRMLRGDASRRSFYLRLREDVGEASLRSALDAAVAAGQCAPPAVAAAAAAAGVGAGAAGPGAPRQYFWLTDADLPHALASLGRMKSLLARPPSLAERSGVPEVLLRHLGAWVREAAAAAAAQQQQAQHAARDEAQQLLAAQHAASPGAPNPAALLGRRHLPASTAAALRRLLLPAPAAAQQQPAPGQLDQQLDQQAAAAAPPPGQLSAAASASATAMAVYQDLAHGGIVVAPVRWGLARPGWPLGPAACSDWSYCLHRRPASTSSSPVPQHDGHRHRGPGGRGHWARGGVRAGHSRLHASPAAGRAADARGGGRQRPPAGGVPAGGGAGGGCQGPAPECPRRARGGAAAAGAQGRGASHGASPAPGLGVRRQRTRRLGHRQ